MNRLKAEVIKYSKKLNTTNLSALRSGNISVRTKEKGMDGFYITPSGRKYSSLKTNEIYSPIASRPRQYRLPKLSTTVSNY